MEAEDFWRVREREVLDQISVRVFSARITWNMIVDFVVRVEVEWLKSIENEISEVQGGSAKMSQK